MRGSLWLYPAVETLHIVGLALLVGAMAVFDARVIRAGPGFDLGGWSRSVLPVARAGFALAAAMGLPLFTAEATAYAANPAFAAKLALILLALANVSAFHRLARRTVEVTAALRAAAAVSLVLWAARARLRPVDRLRLSAAGWGLVQAQEPRQRRAGSASHRAARAP